MKKGESFTVMNDRAKLYRFVVHTKEENSSFLSRLIYGKYHYGEAHIAASYVDFDRANQMVLFMAAPDDRTPFLSAAFKMENVMAVIFDREIREKGRLYTAVGDNAVGDSDEMRERLDQFMRDAGFTVVDEDEDCEDEE